MDTSKEYIKMCDKAKEIQEIFKIKGLGENDFINRDKQNPKRKGFIIIIWLPRQDQLQGIYLDIPNTVGRMIIAFNSFTDKRYKRIHWKPLHYFPSMEQLWLAFVMKEENSKVWTGEDWVSESKDNKN